MVIYKCKLPKLGPNGLACLNIRANDVIAIGNVLEKVGFGNLIKNRYFHEL
jgi:hypothetical protein